MFFHFQKTVLLFFCFLDTGCKIGIYPTGQGGYVRKPVFEGNFLSGLATLHVFDGNLTLETFTEFLSTHNSKF